MNGTHTRNYLGVARLHSHTPEGGQCCPVMVRARYILSGITDPSVEVEHIAVEVTPRMLMVVADGLEREADFSLWIDEAVPATVTFATDDCIGSGWWHIDSEAAGNAIAALLMRDHEEEAA